MGTTRITVAVIALLAALSLAATASAKGDDGTSVGGTCSAASTAALKAKQDDRRLEVEFEVDSNVRRQHWNVVLQDNGTPFLEKTLKTKGKSGSFKARAKPLDLVGTDTIQATATNSVTGESCTATLAV